MLSRLPVFRAAVLATVTMLAAVAPAFASPADEAEVGRAVEAWRRAMVAGDGKALTALAHPDLQFGHSNGLIQTREMFVETVVNKSEIFRSINLTNKSVKIVGDNALQRHVFNADILLSGKRLVVSLGLLEVWQRQNDGRWLLLARQAFNTGAPMPKIEQTAEAAPANVAAPGSVISSVAAGAAAAAIAPKLADEEASESKPRKVATTPPARPKANPQPRSKPMIAKPVAKKAKRSTSAAERKQVRSIERRANLRQTVKRKPRAHKAAAAAPMTSQPALVYPGDAPRTH